MANKFPWHVMYYNIFLKKWRCYYYCDSRQEARDAIKRARYVDKNVKMKIVDKRKKTKKQKKIYYMHLVEGKPGYFENNEQIVIAYPTDRIKLCSSLDQIKKEQELTKQFRLDNYFSYDPDDYDYQIVCLP